MPTPRNLRQRIDDHPAALFVGIAIAAATATLGIVLPIAQLTQDSRVASVQAELAQLRSEQQMVVDGLEAQLDRAKRDAESAAADERARAQTRIDELERSLSSITRTLGDTSGTSFLDVSTLVVAPRDAAAIPDTSAFDPTDRFYALDPTQAAGWTSTIATDLQLTAALYGMTEEQARANQGQDVIERMTRFPIHAWYFGDDKVATFKDPYNDAPVTLHPRTMAVVQRVSHDDYVASGISGLGEGAANVVRDGFGRDPAGWALQDQLLADITWAGTLRPRVESLQKQDDIAYGRVEMVLPNVTVDGVEHPEYYWTREWLIVDTGEDLYLVKLFVADDDHRSPDYAAIAAWLDGLRIVRS